MTLKKTLERFDEFAKDSFSEEELKEFIAEAIKEAQKEVRVEILNGHNTARKKLKDYIRKYLKV